MEVNQDPIILEAEVVLEDMEDLEVVADMEDLEAEIPETVETVKKDMTIKRVEIATVAVVDGNTVKLKDLNSLIILR